MVYLIDNLERVIQNNSLIASSTQTNNFLNHLLKKGGGFNQNMNNGLPTGGGLIQGQNKGIPDGDYSKRHPVMQEMMQGTQEEQEFEENERDHENAHKIITNESIDEQEDKINEINNRGEKRIEGVVKFIMADKKLADGKTEDEVDEIKRDLVKKEVNNNPKY